MGEITEISAQPSKFFDDVFSELNTGFLSHSISYKFKGNWNAEGLPEREIRRWVGRKQLLLQFNKFLWYTVTRGKKAMFSDGDLCHVFRFVGLTSVLVDEI